jgi:hypothetical protein
MATTLVVAWAMPTTGYRSTPEGATASSWLFSTR